MQDDQAPPQSQEGVGEPVGTPASSRPRLAIGDTAALGSVYRRHRERIRRIVAVRLASRLARLLAEDALPWEAVRASRSGLRVDASEAEVVQWMARAVEREVRRRPESGFGPPRDPSRTLRVDDPEARVRRQAREEQEQKIDARVAELEPAELREALLLRDYSGADWELVRDALGLRSTGAAQRLYRRAHEQLAQRLRARMRSGHGRSA